MRSVKGRTSRTCLVQERGIVSKGLRVQNAGMTRKYLVSCVVALLFCACSSVGQEDVIGLYLTWKGNPSTSITINWINLYKESTTNVWYRTAGSQEWKSASGTRHPAGHSTLQIRRVHLSDLQPDTLYEFTIQKEAPDDQAVLHRFRTMPSRLDRTIRFVTGGDMMHNRKFLDATNEQAGKLNPDFALLGGDLAYANGVSASRWIDWFQSWYQLVRGKDGVLVPMVVAIGNHEVQGGYNQSPEQAPYFYTLFDLPQNRTYYALDFGNYLSLLVMDSAHTQPISGPQTDWLDRTLSDRTNRKFVFACYHWPIYGTTKAPPDQLPCEHPRSVEMRKEWVPRFERYGISAAFENDHHNFKRSKRIRNHRVDPHTGLLYLGDGSWGVNTRSVPPLDRAWYLEKAEPRRHLWHVILPPEGPAYVEAIDQEGRVFDKVRLDMARTPPEEPRP